MTEDPFALVRAWFDALNRGDVPAMSELYAADAELDADEGVLRGTEAISAALAARTAATAGAFEDGARRRMRTMAHVENGLSVEWIARERMLDTGTVEMATGYDHFFVAGGLIRHQREVRHAADAGAMPADEAVPSPRRYPDRPVVGVGAVVIDAGSVVLIKRRFEPLAGQWSLPGGTLELGETLAAGVAREVFEETGLDVDVGEVVEVFDRILLDPDARVRYHFVLIDYLCRPRGGTLAAGSDVADARWVRPADLPSFRLTPKATAVVERALALAGAAGFGQESR
jgi:ADP-ribose pyrophosphatase YjhB (NUDIX family)